MVDWTTSIFPHRCRYCKRWIKPRVKHIGIYERERKVERYCDPCCASVEVEQQRKIDKRREELALIIYGDKE